MFTILPLLFALHFALAYDPWNDSKNNFYRSDNERNPEKPWSSENQKDFNALPDVEVSPHLVQKLLLVQNSPLVEEIDNNLEIFNPNLLPYLRPQNNERIKRSMDEFTLHRRETLFTLPGSNINNINKLNNYKTVKTTPPSKHGLITKDYDDFEKDFDAHAEDTNDRLNSIIEDETLNSEEVKVMLSKVFKKQTDLLVKLHTYLRNENSVQRAGKDFDQLLQEIENKRNNASSVDVKLFEVATKGPKSEIPVVRTLIDQTEVKRALMNDPYVQRILSMNKVRRANYEKQYRMYKNALDRVRYANRNYDY